MTITALPPLDQRDALNLLADLLQRQPGYLPDWQPGTEDPGLALEEIAARYLQAILQRLNQAPYKNELAFLDLMGVRLAAAQAARAPVVFRLAQNAIDTHLPAGTRLAAPPPPGATGQILFETEEPAGLAVARLQEIFSLWPGRDQYIDHSAAFRGGQPFQPFLLSQLQDTPHALYLAHNTLLALSGKARIDVAVELLTPSSQALDIFWEYWDGKVWREFLHMQPECNDTLAHPLDSTRGLTRTGRFRLETDCAQAQPTLVNGQTAYWVRGRLAHALPIDPSRSLPELNRIYLSTSFEQAIVLVGSNGTILDTVSHTISGSSEELESWITAQAGGSVKVRDGLLPDAAFSGPASLDVTKPFYPFGLSVQPGSAFYFSCQDAFSKPGARLSLYLERTSAPTDQLNIPVGGKGTSSGEDLAHTLVWEYWNGQEWSQALPPFTYTDGNDKDPLDLNKTGLVSIIIPKDMEKTSVNKKDGLWMRVRLLSGGYGFKQTINLPHGSGDFTFVVPQPPALSAFRLGYTWQYGPYSPEVTLTYNDFQYEDHSVDARWEGHSFRPYHQVGDITPALYLGFDQPLPVDNLGIYFNIQEQRGQPDNPALLWEYWDGGAWQGLPVQDETAFLRIPGMLEFIGPPDMQALARLDNPLYWLRARQKEDAPPASPLVLGVFPNAVWAAQHQTTLNEPLGASTGQPDQVFRFRQAPVLAGEQVEVQEVSGPRANVEWREIAQQLFGRDPHPIQAIETLLAAEGAQTDIRYGDLRLKRDRNKRVVEAWVHWYGQPTLYLSGPGDRHYTVDRALGRLVLGNNITGRVPPPGAAIQAALYRSGGGLSSNLDANAIKQVLGPIGGVEGVFNPVPASGGADGETLASLARRGPATLRSRGRVLAAADYEALARQASVGSPGTELEFAL